MAPEFLDRGCFTERSDIFSFGIMLYELFNPLTSQANVHRNSQPYPDLQAVQIMYQVVNESLRPNIDELKRRKEF